MRNLFARLGSILVLAATALGQTSAPAKADSSATKPPVAPRFDIANIDTSVDPCTDFYQYACGNWIKNNPIPPDYPSWVSFAEVEEYNLATLHRILDKASSNDPQRGPVVKKIGDFYASCMDESAGDNAALPHAGHNHASTAGMQALHRAVKRLAHGTGNALRQFAQGFGLNTDNVGSNGVHW